MSNESAQTSADSNSLALLKQMGAEAPWVRSFQGLHHATMAKGSLEAKTKELMSLAISINSGCEDCIDLHLGAALQNGASRGEILETIGVAVTMGGGPALMYGLKAFRRLPASD